MACHKEGSWIIVAETGQNIQLDSSLKKNPEVVALLKHWWLCDGVFKRDEDCSQKEAEREFLEICLMCSKTVLQLYHKVNTKPSKVVSVMEQAENRLKSCGLTSKNLSGTQWVNVLRHVAKNMNILPSS